MARPKAKINPDELEKLYGMQCTDDEVAAFLGVSVRTIARRKQVKKLQEVIERAKAKGRVSLRRSLFRLALNGNVAAAIFLAKNLLGMKDYVANEMSAPNGGPIQIGPAPEMEKLTDDELKQLATVFQKLQQPRKG